MSQPNDDTQLKVRESLQDEGIDMPDDAVEYIASQFDTVLDGKTLSADEKSTLIAMSVAGLAAFTLLRPDNAHAFSGFVNGVIGGITKPLTDLASGILAPVMSLFGQGQEDNAMTTTTTVASAADSMNAVSVAQYNNSLRADAAPQPMECESDSNAERCAYGEANTHAVTDAVSLSLSVESLKEGPNDRAMEIRYQRERFKDGKNLDASIIYNDMKDDDDREAANAFLRNVGGVENKTPRLSQINSAIAIGDRAAADRMQAEKATAMCRRQIAMRPLVKCMASHDTRPSGGEPRPTDMSAIKEEIDRTFGKDSAQFRAEVRDHVSSTPLLKETTMQQCFTNYLLIKQCEELREGNLLAAVETLEMLDSE